MRYFVSYDLFIFQCIEFKSNKVIFTYKTNKKEVPKIIIGYFSLIKELCNSENFQKDFLSQKNRNCHKVENLKDFDLIRNVYKETGYKEQWISQNLLDSPNIYQIKFGNQAKRMIFIMENLKEEVEETKQKRKKQEECYVIKPLFLDLVKSKIVCKFKK